MKDGTDRSSIHVSTGLHAIHAYDVFTPISQWQDGQIRTLNFLRWSHSGRSASAFAVLPHPGTQTARAAAARTHLRRGGPAGPALWNAPQPLGVLTPAANGAADDKAMAQEMPAAYARVRRAQEHSHEHTKYSETASSNELSGYMEWVSRPCEPSSPENHRYVCVYMAYVRSLVPTFNLGICTHTNTHTLTHTHTHLCM